MSSRPDRKASVEAWLVVLGFAACMVWYASGQLLRSLYFAYQLAQYLFPQWLPAIRGSGG